MQRENMGVRSTKSWTVDAYGGIGARCVELRLSPGYIHDSKSLRCKEMMTISLTLAHATHRITPITSIQPDNTANQVDAGSSTGKKKGGHHWQVCTRADVIITCLIDSNVQSSGTLRQSLTCGVRPWLGSTNHAAQCPGN